MSQNSAIAKRNRQHATRVRSPRKDSRRCEWPMQNYVMAGLNPKRTVAELKELRALTGDENGAQRVAWTDTWLKAREWFASKVRGLPVENHYDAAGNNCVTLRGACEKALLIDGQSDPVPTGGWV